MGGGVCRPHLRGIYMKDIFTAPFVEKMKETTANMYRLGWDERNGGNISYLLDEDEVRVSGHQQGHPHYPHRL